MGEHDMEDLALQDLDRAEEGLYFAARRYCMIVERGFVQAASRMSIDDPSFVAVGGVADDLAEAGQRYREAHLRWEKLVPGKDT